MIDQENAYGEPKPSPSDKTQAVPLEPVVGIYSAWPGNNGITFLRVPEIDAEGKQTWVDHGLSRETARRLLSELSAAIAQHRYDAEALVKAHPVKVPLWTPDHTGHAPARSAAEGR